MQLNFKEMKRGQGRSNSVGSKVSEKEVLLHRNKLQGVKTKCRVGMGHLVSLIKLVLVECLN